MSINWRYFVISWWVLIIPFYYFLELKGGRFRHWLALISVPVLLYVPTESLREILSRPRFQAPQGLQEAREYSQGLLKADSTKVRYFILDERYGQQLIWQAQFHLSTRQHFFPTDLSGGNIAVCNTDAPHHFKELENAKKYFKGCRDLIIGTQAYVLTFKDGTLYELLSRGDKEILGSDSLKEVFKSGDTIIYELTVN